MHAALSVPGSWFAWTFWVACALTCLATVMVGRAGVRHYRDRWRAYWEPQQPVLVEQSADPEDFPPSGPVSQRWRQGGRVWTSRGRFDPYTREFQRWEEPEEELPVEQPKVPVTIRR